jgi:alpha-tubulin suppressor-like RCC1 family protein
MHTCAVDFSGRAFCWGNGENGQIGNGTITRVSFWPRRVAGVIRFDRVTAEGWYSSCAESSTNQAYCWGDNREGQLGDGTKAPRLVPTAVVGGLRFRQLSINGFSACGKTDEATLYCWGYNGNGQLGDGTTTRRLTPTPVADPE